MWSRLDRWGDPPHVTSPIWGPPPPCKQVLRYQMTYRLFSALSLSLPADGDEYSALIEPAQVLLHVLSDHTVVLFAETWDRKNMGEFKHFKLEIRVSQNLVKLSGERGVGGIHEDVI